MKSVLITQRSKFEDFNTEFNREWVDMTTAVLFIFAVEKQLPATYEVFKTFVEGLAYANDARLEFLSFLTGGATNAK